MNERRFRRGLITLVIAVVILTSVVYILPEPVRGASPTINYVSPADEATFVDVWRGEGVNLTVNVTDADGDLNQVVLKWNNSGTWATFYDSGALGGVSYHNVTVLNSNFTGSWETYEWQICAYDTAWSNVTYSFTTEYVFGDPQLLAYDDSNPLYFPTILKNNTNDYFLAWVNWNQYDVEARHSTDISTFIFQSTVDVETDTRNDGYNVNAIAYLYNYGKCYIAYIDDGGGSTNRGYYHTKYWNGTAWVGKTTTNVENMFSLYVEQGLSIKYFNGEWHTIYASYAGNAYPAVKWMHGSTPFSGTASTLEQSSSNYKDHYFYISAEVFKGKLIVVYRDNGLDLHWQVYNGTSWTDKGDIEPDIDSCCVIKDPVNNQLVIVYIASGNMYYRILTDPDGTWSEPHLIFTPPTGKTIKDIYAQYIDRRIVAVFSYNFRSTYDIYMITAPDYTAVISGINITTNRIQFPDATPNQEHVNSTVIAIKNINDRPILNITWHVGNIGEIQTANNVRVWSNMSGSWQSWLVGADQNTSEIDISAVKGSEWMPGETLYWKIEILNTGNVAETLHTNDNDIWYIVDLGT